jgi:hypothetical protein
MVSLCVKIENDLSSLLRRNKTRSNLAAHIHHYSALLRLRRRTNTLALAE